MNYLIILNDPPYGAECSYNGLRLANSLAKGDSTTVSVFLIGDAASCAVANQTDGRVDRLSLLKTPSAGDEGHELHGVASLS